MSSVAGPYVRERTAISHSCRSHPRAALSSHEHLAPRRARDRRTRGSRQESVPAAARPRRACGRCGLPAIHSYPNPRIEIGPADGVFIANDKWVTYRRLADAGVAVPRSVLPSHLNERVGQSLGDMVVVKPRVSRGGRDVSLRRGPASRSSDDSMIVQEFVPGTEYAPNLYLSSESEVVVVLEKTELTHGDFGIAKQVHRLDVCQDLTSLPWLFGPLGRWDSPVRWTWKIRRRADGVPVVLGINARFGAYSA